MHTCSSARHAVHEASVQVLSAKVSHGFRGQTFRRHFHPGAMAMKSKLYSQGKIGKLKKIVLLSKL